MSVFFKRGKKSLAIAIFPPPIILGAISIILPDEFLKFKRLDLIGIEPMTIPLWAACSPDWTTNLLC